MSLNRVQLIGRIGKAPELRKTPTGKDVCVFSLCTNEPYYDNNVKKEKTNWHRVVAFQSAARMCMDRLYKDNMVYLEGRISQGSFLDKDNVERKSYEVISTFIDFDISGSKS